MNNKTNGNPTAVIVLIVIIVCLAMSCSSGSGSSSSSKSGKRWSDLSEVEKQNARDAYKMKQYIDSINK